MITKEHQSKIEAYLEGIFNLSPAATESYFSKHPCECCNSPLGGDRYDFTGRLGERDGEIVELSCCIDCFGYLFT